MDYTTGYSLRAQDENTSWERFVRQDVIVWMQQRLLWTSGVVGHGVMTHFPFLPALFLAQEDIAWRHIPRACARHKAVWSEGQSSTCSTIKLVVIWSVRVLVCPAYQACLRIVTVWLWTKTKHWHFTGLSWGWRNFVGIKQSHLLLLQRAGANLPVRYSTVVILVPDSQYSAHHHTQCLQEWNRQEASGTQQWRSDEVTVESSAELRYEASVTTKKNVAGQKIESDMVFRTLHRMHRLGPPEMTISTDFHWHFRAGQSTEMHSAFGIIWSHKNCPYTIFWHSDSGALSGGLSPSHRLRMQPRRGGPSRARCTTTLTSQDLSCTRHNRKELLNASTITTHRTPRHARLRKPQKSSRSQ